MIVLLVACTRRPIAPQPNVTRATNRAPIIGVTGPPELLPSSEPMALPSWPLASFLASEARTRSSKYHVPLQHPPDQLSVNPRGGLVSLGMTRVAWVIDGEPVTGFRLWVDSDRDGDLRDERAHSLQQVGYEWHVVVSAVGTTAAGPQTPIAFRVRLSERGVTADYQTIRTGHVRIDGVDIRFGVTGVWGYYGLAANHIVFDRDGNNLLGTRTDSTEATAIWQRVVELRGHTYRIDVPIDGSRLTLTPTDDHVIATPKIGGPMPPLTTRSLDSRTVSLARDDRKYVLLDFWSVTCAPCVRALPRIAELAATRDVEVIGVTFGEPDVELDRFVREHGITWTIVVEDIGHGLLHSTFRPSAMPMYILANRDGVIVYVGPDLEQVERQIEH
ncbi:MAG TPA: TlpA disulfide reductase family protein [Kofleriaceae bacterium]|nr:TlpA disulfide reductase family protein [Kofleriaceae bacterium]